MTDTALHILQNTFGYPAFRGEQEAVVETLCAGGDALVLMPTGGGKSLCYQIPALVRDGTALACAEMLLGGVTCFNDMYYFPGAALEAALAAGMRSSHGMVVLETPSAYASDAEDYLRKGLELRDRNREQPHAAGSPGPHYVRRAIPTLDHLRSCRLTHSSRADTTGCENRQARQTVPVAPAKSRTVAKAANPIQPKDPASPESSSTRFFPDLR